MQVYVNIIKMKNTTKLKIELFISTHRKKLIERLLSAKIISKFDEVDDVIYLNSENGKEVLPDAAYQEFRRLAQKAGIQDKACQKMFRHRFITNMVKLHLIGFMDKNPLKSRQLITDSDYRTILAVVSKYNREKMKPIPRAELGNQCLARSMGRDWAQRLEEMINLDMVEAARGKGKGRPPWLYWNPKVLAWGATEEGSE